MGNLQEVVKTEDSRVGKSAWEKMSRGNKATGSKLGLWRETN